MLISPQSRSAAFALLLATAASWATFVPSSNAFVPPVPTNLLSKTTTTRTNFGLETANDMNAIRSKHLYRPTNNRQQSSFALQMAAEDFNESKYTEAAWSAIASLTKVADYYSATTVESPLLLDILLNPGKHNAGESAEAAKKVVEKVLQTAGVDVKELRKKLESYLAGQAKVTGSGSTQKALGPYLTKVLESARTVMSVLGVSVLPICFASEFRLPFVD